MFRRWLSSFIRKYKKVILDLAKKFAMLILIALIATSIMIGLKNNDTSTSETENSISVYKPEETVIEGKKITKEDYSKDEEIIENFIKYCNNEDITSAYELLSDECKTELYPTIEEFKNNYYDSLFTEKKDYNLQSWINDNDYHTYRVRFISDILSTGNYDDSKKGQDYITVDVSSEEPRINIDGFIRKEEINKESSSEAVKALAVEKSIYINYEIYTLKIKNITSSNILLDTNKKSNSIQLLDENDVKYNAYKGETYNLNMKLSPGTIRTLKIKFNMTYDKSIKGKCIKFSDIVTDIKQYNSSSEYKDRVTIEIEI